MIFLDVVILIVGFIALVKGADWFVDGSAALAKNFRVPGLIIGLTIVALGTSAPELAVSTTAAIQGSNEIALSNVVGSNIFNLLCVLGFCSVIHPVPVDKIVLKRDFPISIVAAVFVLAMAGFTAIRTNGFADIRMDANAGMISRIEQVCQRLVCCSEVSIAGQLWISIHQCSCDKTLSRVRIRRPAVDTGSAVGSRQVPVSVI